MGTTIRTSRFGLDATQLLADREERERVDQLARDNWDDNEWRHSFHEDLVEAIWLGFMHENLLELMTTVENAEEFERISVEIVEGLEVFWVSAGSSIDASTIQAKSWELMPAYVGYHVTEFEEHIRSGFSKYFDKLVPLAVTQMDAAINSRLLRTIQAAITTGSDFYEEMNSGFDLSVVDTALEEVDDTASGWPEAGAGDVAIIGRPRMTTALINAIKDDNTFAPETNEQIIQLGVLGQYRGAKIIKLRNWKDRNKVSYFPGNELIISSTAASKVGFWGGMKSREWTEEGGEYWHNWGKRKAGFAVHHPEFARRLKDTTKSVA
jgi:hypothetical protein